MGLEQFQAQHPGTEILLLEPDHDATMFLYSPTNFAARRAILEDGYTTTRRALRDEESALRRALIRRGLVPKPTRPTLRPPPP
jgi:hypothetical protein